MRFNHMELTLPPGVLAERRQEIAAFYADLFGWEALDVPIVGQLGLLLRTDPETSKSPPRYVVPLPRTSSSRTIAPNRETKTGSRASSAIARSRCSRAARGSEGVFLKSAQPRALW